MAKNGKTSVVYKGFVRQELSGAQKAKLRDEYKRDIDLLVQVQSLCEKGYNLTLKLDTADGGEGTILAWLYCADSGSPNCGYTLSGRGSDVHKAIAVVLYKHFSVFKEKWPLPQAEKDWREADL